MEFPDDSCSLEYRVSNRLRPQVSLSLCKELKDSRKASLWLLLLPCTAPFPVSNPSNPPRTTTTTPVIDTNENDEVSSPCGSYCCCVLLLVSYLFCLGSSFRLQRLSMTRTTRNAVGIVSGHCVGCTGLFYWTKPFQKSNESRGTSERTNERHLYCPFSAPLL